MRAFLAELRGVPFVMGLTRYCGQCDRMRGFWHRPHCGLAGAGLSPAQTQALFDAGQRYLDEHPEQGRGRPSAGTDG